MYRVAAQANVESGEIMLHIEVENGSEAVVNEELLQISMVSPAWYGHSGYEVGDQLREVNSDDTEEFP